MKRTKVRKKSNGKPRRVHVTVGFARRKPSEVEIRAKAALLGLLTQAERDPARVIQGFARLGETVESAYRFVQENPKQARAKAGELGLALLASLARKSLTDKA